MGMRSAVFDKWVNDRISVMDDPVVIHIGCGMDSRISIFTLSRKVNICLAVFG